jgi:multidrug efflux pump subunit AcrA (membrane-fusion protein)
VASKASAAEPAGDRGVAPPVLDQPAPVADDLSTPGLRADLSGGLGGPTRQRRPTGSGWRAPFRIGAVVLLLAAALIAWELTRGSTTPSYRTSVVGTGTVVATLDSVATITPVDQANLNFNVSGTVSTVDVSVGQQVTSGQTLASLNLADLDGAVVSAQAAVASAQATLAAAEASETSTSPTPSPGSPATGPGTSGSGRGSSTPTTPVTAGPAPSTGSSTQIDGLQAALVGDQKQLDADSIQATAALQQATTACENTSSSATTGSTASAGSGTFSDPSALSGPPGAATGGTGAPTCTQSLSLASSAQAAVTADVKRVIQAETQLDNALGAPAASAGAAHPTGAGGITGTHGGPSGSPATEAVTTAAVVSTGTDAGSGTMTVDAATGSGTDGGSAGSGTKKATPQQLAVDQASIDTATAELSDAQLAAGGSNLVSTITGTVAAVSIAAGDSVTAGSTSSTAQVVVIGMGSSYEASTDIPVADIGKIVLGQEAMVTPDATNSVVTGRVTGIGVLATGSASATTYPVTITLASKDLGGLSGADAAAEIVLKRSVGVTTVPSSAVRTVGSDHEVTVVMGGTTKAVPVTLGTVGDLLTQVTSGVTAGETVVLADLDEPLPATSSGTTRTGFGGAGAGGFPGGGFTGGGGGFPGGGRFGG